MAQSDMLGDKPSQIEEDLVAMTEKALTGPGVAEMMALYEAAEKAYSNSASLSIQEPKIWFASSTK